MNKKLSLILLLLAFLCLSTIASAEEKKSVPDSKSKPVVAEKVEQQPEKVGIPVLVEHVGNDVLGGTLALKLKESFRKSVLFSLSDKGSKSVRIKLVSRSEFNERPEIGSVYAVVWTFAESEDVVPFYLEQDLGLINSQALDTSAAKLMNRTDKIAGDYKYLFE